MTEAKCPACGAPVQFLPGGGPIKVCEHCNTVVARAGARFESLGKVAQLTDTDSPLAVGLFGKYDGVGFQVAGRIQKERTHAASSIWDEWFLVFDDERNGWLAEAEGEWNLMFPAAQADIPSWEQAAPGRALQLSGKRFVVEEQGEARTVAAEGQLPAFAQKHPYADCTGPRGVFASIDYGGEKPEAFVGSRVSLPRMGFDLKALHPTPKRDALQQARCTNCNGPLELKAPDAAVRVACPFCGALLDVKHGALSFLRLLEKPQQTPLLPLGAKGKLADLGETQPTEWTVLAFLLRSCEVEGTRYPWEEYLLWEKAHGFRWLMQSNGHWTFLKPVPAGEVVLAGKGAKHEGVDYARYQAVNARTDYVLGECYWAVEAGEEAHATEYIAPPYSLNLDATESEITWTKGQLLEPGVVRTAFAPKETLPAPKGIAPAAFNPWKERAGEWWKWTLVWSAAIFALFVVFSIMSPGGTFLDTQVSPPPGAAPGSGDAMVFSDPFEIPQNTPVDVRVEAPGLSNQWAGVQVDLVNEKTFEVASVYTEPSDYHGYTDGENWSEGDRSQLKTIDTVDKGTYRARVTFSFDPGKPPPQPISVKVSASGAGLCCPFVFMALLLGLAIFASVRSSAFESARWEDSVVQPAQFHSTGYATLHDREDPQGDDE